MKNHGSVKRSAISSPLELLSTTNVLAYTAPNIYGSSDESDNSMTFSGSSRATTPESDAPSPIEPNHLSTYFNSARSVSTRRSKDSIGNDSPLIPKRMPSHTMKSHQAAARKRTESQTYQQPPNTIHNPAEPLSPMNSTMFSSKPDASHPFGAELAQVNEVAEGFGARDVIVMDEEERFLMENGLCKFGAQDYVGEIQGLFGGHHNNPFSPLVAPTMADSEPPPEKVETPAVDGSATNKPQIKKTHGAPTVKNGQEASRTEQEKKVGDFGLPGKQIERRSSAPLEYETASENEGWKASKQTPAHILAQDALPAHEPGIEPQEKVTKHTTEKSTANPKSPHDDSPIQPTTPQATESSYEHTKSEEIALPAANDILHGNTGAVSGWSHQALAPQKVEAEDKKEEEDWQNMPSYAPYDLYDDEGNLIAREAPDSDEEANVYAGLGGAGKGYTRVQIDEDAKSATSMDDNTDYLFKPKGTDLADEDEEQRDPLAQLQATKGLLTEGQRIAYVGVTRLAMADMVKDLEGIEATKNTKKGLGFAIESTKMWSQKMMVRLYMHMEIDSSEQIMIEQLPEHGVLPSDLTPALMQNARVKNPMAEKAGIDGETLRSLQLNGENGASGDASLPSGPSEEAETQSLPSYKEHEDGLMHEVRTPFQLGTSQNIDIDLRWTVLCDLFLVLLADSIYDARSRTLLERVGKSLEVPWLDICRFEKRVTDALEMQEAANKETWDEAEHMENRRKRALKRRYVMMGLATVGGSLVIGLSAGLLAPVIGAGLAAGFTTIGVAGTSGFLAGAGGTALITSGAVVTGGTIAVRASHRRTGAVQTFEYRPLHNNKRVNLIVTISGWMSGKVDDVRLPFSTVNPVMGDMYSLLWEPDMLQSMGQTINILATEALTQGLQQVLGSTILVALMASLQLPIVLTKLSYLIDNPWTVSMGRANAAGLILADSLVDRNLGARPITLVGFSLGSRVIFAALRELANKGAFGLVQNVYLFGSPIVANKDEYLRARSVVSGRFVNGYASNDWILGYLFRATSGGIMRVAGLAPVENIHGLENIDVTQLVNGHMAYRSAMPKLLRKVGWEVESDEFTEIEDPDPNNHEQRQRELIRELDEARKEAGNKSGKKRFGFFKRGKLAEKKGWETYDDRMREQGNDFSTHAAEGQSNVLFDIEAIKAELASEQIEVRQLESTLPPMKLNVNGAVAADSDKSQHNPYSTLRATKSYDESITYQLKPGSGASQASLPNGYKSNPFHQGYDEYNLSEEAINGRLIAEDTKLSLETLKHLSSPQHSPCFPSNEPGPPPPLTKMHDVTPPAERPALRTIMTSPASATSRVSVEHNAWADEDDEEFGKEQEVKLTF
ncbi:MAG: hypothetical protein Q9217_005149 [Psora testacea]